MSASLFVSKAPLFQRSVPPLFRATLLGAMALFCSATAKAEPLPQSCTQGDQHLSKGHYSEALSAYNQCLTEAPEHTNAYFNRAGAYTGLKKWAEAIKDYDVVLERLPLDKEAYYHRGNLHHQLKHSKAALDDLSLAAELDPDNPKFSQRLVDVSLAYGQTAQALTFFDTQISINPTSTYYLQRGTLYKQDHQLSKALQDFTQAIQLEPKSSQAWFERGLTYFKMQKHPQAIYDFGQAIKHNPQMALAYYNRGLAYQVQNKCYPANQDFRQACKLGDKTACSKSCKTP